MMMYKTIANSFYLFYGLSQTVIRVAYIENVGPIKPDTYCTHMFMEICLKCGCRSHPPRSESANIQSSDLAPF